MIGTNFSCFQLNSSLSPIKSWNKPDKVFKYFQLLLASILASLTSFSNFEKGLVQVDLVFSKNLLISSTSFDLIQSKIELRFLALFSQNSISLSGPGSLYCFKTISGSNFNTFLIYLDQVIMELSQIWALSFSEIFGSSINFFEGIGSMVLPLLNPIMT